MNLSVVLVKGKERKHLLDALEELCGIDADFSGENGIEYNWDETNALGFESNAKYCLDQIKDIASDKDAIEQFITLWISNDPYYTDYALQIIYDENEKATCIAVSTN